MSNRPLKVKASVFAKKHAEIWKIILWSLTGVGASTIEVIIHMLMLNYLFGSLREVVITNAVLSFLGIQYKGYMFAYFFSAIIGYSIAFIVNRKVTFKADNNPTVSYIINFAFTVFNIFVITWMGSVLSNFSVEYAWGNIGDLIIKVVVMTIPSVWTYPMNRFVIHRQTKKPAGETAETPKTPTA